MYCNLWYTRLKLSLYFFDNIQTRYRYHNVIACGINIPMIDDSAKFSFQFYFRT